MQFDENVWDTNCGISKYDTKIYVNMICALTHIQKICN